MSIWLQGNYIHFVCIRKLVGSSGIRHKKWKILFNNNNNNDNEENNSDDKNHIIWS